MFVTDFTIVRHLAQKKYFRSERMNKMSSELLRIKSLKNSMSPTYQQLAQYILDNADDVPFLSVHELARRADVSVATVSRFSNSLGYESFKRFKTQLGKDSLFSFADIFEGIKSGDKDGDIVEKVFKGNIRSIEDTLRMLDMQKLIAGAQAIAQSKRLLCCGVGSSGFMASDAALRFIQLDIQAEGFSDSYQMLMQALRLGKGCVAMGISHSGRSEAVVKALRIARENGALTLGISNYLQSPLHESSDIFLCTSFQESRVKAAALSSRVAQVTMLDCLYLLAARSRKVEHKFVERVNAVSEEHIRIDE